MAAIFELKGSIVVHPTPGFVVKTKIVEGKGDHLYSTKVFINVCHDSKVPRPPTDFDPAVTFPMIVDNQWEIPVIVSLEKKSTDKKGVPSFVYDCCMNSECFQWVQINKDLKLIAVEWCIEAIELMHELVLEREYSVPKMLQKGELSNTEISSEEMTNGLQKRIHDLKQNETLGLIQALEPLDSEEDTELPDLMNIGGSRLKPLIEEIEEMSIEDRRAKEPLVKEVKEENRVTKLELGLEVEHLEASLTKLIPGTEENESALTETATTRNLKQKNSEVKPYVFSITLHTRNNDHYIKFESAQLNDMVEVSFHESFIRITNLDPKLLLTQDNHLDIALPSNATPYKCFIVKKDLYVFCHVRESL
ncbi:CIC11C00000002275 [Sungouiella intermedia]|uniref:CIC11C00000002275 n=1 Tax=Sungouiella intermedia TaxID=45354 RepID=A0A1L0DB49_9ASCO|nr:CIC11C00000002275 [[Candida] intermedia]